MMRNINFEKELLNKFGSIVRKANPRLTYHIKCKETDFISDVTSLHINHPRYHGSVMITIDGDQLCVGSKLIELSDPDIIERLIVIINRYFK